MRFTDVILQLPFAAEEGATDESIGKGKSKEQARGRRIWCYVVWAGGPEWSSQYAYENMLQVEAQCISIMASCVVL